MIRFAGEFADAARGALELDRLLGPGTVRLAGKSPKHGLVQVLMSRVLTEPRRHGFGETRPPSGVPLELWIDKGSEQGEARSLAPCLAQLLGERIAVRLGPAKTLIFFAEPK